MRFLRVGGVIFGALIVTTLGISAADVFNGNAGSLLGQIISTEEGGCPVGMAAVAAGRTFSCVDIYEASPSSECPYPRTSNAQDTQENLNEIECVTASVSGASPWTHVTREQARAMCVRSGKRLPNPEEWYMVAIGTPNTDEACNTNGGGVQTGVHESCKSATGVFDAVGNVWEWTSGDVINGEFEGRVLPGEGYVSQVSSDGMAVMSGKTASEEFAEDYVWTHMEGVYGILRGGFYGSGSDAGVYALQAKTLPTAATVAVGFRCVI